MAKVTTRTEIDLIVMIRQCHIEIEIEVEVGMHKTMDKITGIIIEVDYKTITKMTLGEDIIGRCKNTEVSRITEVDVGTFAETIIGTIIETIIGIIIETIIGTITEMMTEILTEPNIEMAILKEKEVHLGKDDPQVMSEGMTESIVDQNQDQSLIQEPVQTEIGLDALNVENMIIFLTIVLTQTWMKN